MKRGDDFFAAVGNKFCCSEHFLPMDYKHSLTGLHVRRDLKLGTLPSVFPWTKVNEESLWREKKTGNFQNDSVVVSPPTLKKWVGEIKMENERLLHDELQECKVREKISVWSGKIFK